MPLACESSAFSSFSHGTSLEYIGHLELGELSQQDNKLRVLDQRAALMNLLKYIPSELVGVETDDLVKIIVTQVIA
jgi:hypothetical protein